MFSRFMPEGLKPDAHHPDEAAPASDAGLGNVVAGSFGQPAEPGKLIRQDLIDAKVRLHRKLIDDLNLALLERLSKEELRKQIGDIVSDYVRTQRILLNTRELELFTTEVFDELTGL